MARGRAWIVAAASLPVFGMAIAAAPAAGPESRTAVTSARATTTVAEMSLNERIVTDFLSRREQAERAQRAIIVQHRRLVDLRRAEFEAAKKGLDEARTRYSEIVGPLPKQGVMNPNDPRLPYEFELRRTWPEPGDSRPPMLSQEPAEKRAAAKSE